MSLPHPSSVPDLRSVRLSEPGKHARIRSLNDQFRQSLTVSTCVPGELRVSEQLEQYSMADLLRVLHRIAQSRSFTDPWGEHSLGFVEFEEETIHWTIVVFADVMCTTPARCPWFASQSFRVLFLTLSGEY